MLDWFSGQRWKGNQSTNICCLDEQSSKSSHSGFPFVNFSVLLEFVIHHSSNRGKLLPLTAFTAHKVSLEQGGNFSSEKASNWLQSGYYNLAIIIQTFGVPILCKPGKGWALQRHSLVLLLSLTKYCFLSPWSPHHSLIILPHILPSAVHSFLQGTWLSRIKQHRTVKWLFLVIISKERRHQVRWTG